MPIKMIGKVELDTRYENLRLYFKLPRIYVENYVGFTHWLLPCTVIGFYSEDGQPICKGIKEEVLFPLNGEGGTYYSAPIMIKCFFDSEDSGNDLAKKYGIGEDYYVEVTIRRLHRALYKDRFFRGPKFIGYKYKDIFPERTIEIIDSSFQSKHKDTK